MAGNLSNSVESLGLGPAPGPFILYPLGGKQTS